MSYHLCYLKQEPFMILCRSVKGRLGPAIIKGFTLVEMLVVIALMVVVMSLLAPAISSMTQSKGFAAAAYDLGALFDQARAYAIANNTYSYVGLLQIPAGGDFSTTAYRDIPDANTGSKYYGSLIACTVASKDGSPGFEYYAVKTSWKANYNKGKNLVQLGKLLRWDNVQLVNLPIPTNQQSGMYRTDPSIGTFKAMILADPSSISEITFSYPLGRILDQGQLNFSRVIIFDPQGIARVVSPNEADVVNYVMEIGLMQTHGNLAPTVPDATQVALTNCAALQFNPMTGSYKVYRP